MNYKHKKNPPQFLEKDFDFCCGLDETRIHFRIPYSTCVTERPIFIGLRLEHQTGYFV